VTAARELQEGSEYQRRNKDNVKENLETGYATYRDAGNMQRSRELPV